MKHAQRMYRELSPETGEFFDMMINEELMDLENRSGKMGGGFCTSFPSLERPYIFANFNGFTPSFPIVFTNEIISPAFIKSVSPFFLLYSSNNYEYSDTNIKVAQNWNKIGDIFFG